MITTAVGTNLEVDYPGLKGGDNGRITCHKVSLRFSEAIHHHILPPVSSVLRKATRTRHCVALEQAAIVETAKKMTKPSAGMFLTISSVCVWSRNCANRRWVCYFWVNFVLPTRSARQAYRKGLIKASPIYKLRKSGSRHPESFAAACSI